MANKVGTSTIFTPSISDQAITQGYYGGVVGDGKVIGDTNLIASNIKSGVTIFGVDGDTNVVNTSSGDAITTDILTGKKAWVDGQEVTGTATAGTPAPTFATTDQTTYNCGALAEDPAQPAVTLQTICGYHIMYGGGCSWNSGTSQCDGGVITDITYMTWYAATASCSEKSDEGSTSWRLPTYTELIDHYLNNNIDGGVPTGFFNPVGPWDQSGYWSGSTYPIMINDAYGVNMKAGMGSSDDGGKRDPYYFVHCVR
jgi:hypothetical protein